MRRGLISEICKRFERRGLSLVAMKMLKPGGELASKHYSPLLACCAKSEVADAVNAIASEPCVATCWKGPSAVGAVVALIGDEDPAAALPGTVRGDLSLGAADSLVECADTAAEAARLEAVWFDPAELCEAATPLLPPPPAATPSSSSAAAPKPAKGAASPAKGGTKAAAKGGGKAAGSAGRYYITTAINYANGPPHMGHAYEGVISDVIARYHRVYGREVYFLTGAGRARAEDRRHGGGAGAADQADRAVRPERRGVQGAEREARGEQRRLRAHDVDHHKRLCQQLWNKAVESGDVYLGMYTGWYNVREETFVTETDAAASDFLDPISGKPLKKMEEPSYFFKMSKFQSKLLQHLKDHPEFVKPDACAAPPRPPLLTSADLR